SVPASCRSVARLRDSAVVSAIGSGKLSFCRACSRLGRCCRPSVRARSRSVVAGHQFEQVVVLWRVLAARPCCCRSVPASCRSVARLPGSA
ncbi:unnamed protein product, partial [Pylaiella littoralis]